MKLIDPKFEIIEQKNGLDGIYKQIELAGRTCYKSENKITPDSAKKFVNMMIKSEHGAMLEHGTVYLAMPMETMIPIDTNGWGKYYVNKYSKAGIVCEVNKEKRVAVTTNLRVLVKNDWMDDLKYLCNPTEYHEKRVTVKFTTEIGITREFNRHRVNSMAEESTRYCNYSKDKFGNEISVILPQEITENQIQTSLREWDAYIWSDRTQSYNNNSFRGMCKAISNYNEDSFTDIDTWLFGNLACEWSYFNLLKLGWKPQQARKVLPLDLKSELVHTAFVSDWEHFFKLRDAKDAHPDAQFLAHPLHEEFINRGYINGKN